MRPIERAMAAAFEAAKQDGAGFSLPLEHPEMNRVRAAYERVVRAVLLSLREPSEAMRKAAVADLDFPWWFQEAVAGGGADQTSCAWSRMIDAALSE